MKKSLKVTLLSLCGIVAVLLAAVLVFVGIYFTRSMYYVKEGFNHLP